MELNLKKEREEIEKKKIGVELDFKKQRKEIENNDHAEKLKLRRKKEELTLSSRSNKSSEGKTIITLVLFFSAWYDLITLLNVKIIQVRVKIALSGKSIRLMYKVNWFSKM